MQWAEFGWLQAQLARFTYKPGWTMELSSPATDEHWDWPTLTIEFAAPDARERGMIAHVQSRQKVPPTLFETKDEQYFAHWLRSCLMDVEHHESREWLRRDGEIYDNPHKEK